jgi:hypothetical protein
MFFTFVEEPGTIRCWGGRAHMKPSNILVLASLSLSLVGCAVGTETDGLPTPTPAKELSAPLEHPGVTPTELEDTDGLRATDTIYDVQSGSDRNAFFNALHEVKGPVNPIPGH